MLRMYAGFLAHLNSHDLYDGYSGIHFLLQQQAHLILMLVSWLASGSPMLWALVYGCLGD